jgi:hypothetical protein
MENGNQARDCEFTADRVSGQKIPLVGAEENRQEFLRVLLEDKGYLKEDILVDFPLEFTVSGEIYTTRLDIVLRIEGRLFAVVKVAAGSLGSREREVVAAARVLEGGPAALGIVTDGRDALVWSASTGRLEGQGLGAVPARADGLRMLPEFDAAPLEGDALKRHRLIFRTYDIANVNVSRKRT